MRVLLLYPEFVEAMWAYKHALQYIGKRASSPPLGLLTVAAMLPQSWEKRLIDLNVSSLKDADFEAVDLVFISAMLAQQHSTEMVLKKCKQLGIPTVGGGPLFSFSEGNQLAIEPDHRICGEAESVITDFLRDIKEARLQKIYQSQEIPDVKSTPVPLWNLVEDLSTYAMMTVQFTRGCPFDCEFCDVVILNGHESRMKTIPQIIGELNALYRLGWRGHVFVCDDNFIGNPRVCREDLLPALIQWMRAHAYPFVLTSAVSINLARNPDIMKMMVEAGFDRVTIGIESPNPDSLKETNKLQNLRQDLLKAIHEIQTFGLEVQAGFIVGFDHDTINIFSEQFDFIQASGIATAMVSILFAFPGTRLYSRLQKENRLLSVELRYHAYGIVNFTPRMGINQLTTGHLELLEMIYSPGYYYQRLKNFLDQYNLPPQHNSVEPKQILLLIKIIWDLGVVDQGKKYFWKMIWYCLRKKARTLPLIIRLLVTGYHFRRDISKYRLALLL